MKAFGMLALIGQGIESRNRHVMFTTVQIISETTLEVSYGDLVAQLQEGRH